MSRFSPAEEETDIWDAFDEAVEHAEQQLKQARENYELIKQTEEPLSEEYVGALTALEETIQGFDSVYEVTETELERANNAAINADFLASVTQAHREYHEHIIERRVSIIREWFDELTECMEDTDTESVPGQSSLQRQMQALEKLTTAGKYGQLLDSDRIELTGVEESIREFDRAVHDRVSANAYIEAGLGVAESFESHYTDNLAELVEKGVDSEAISITEHVADVPELAPVADRLKDGNTTSEDADAVGTAVRTYADVAILTSRRRAKYALGRKLIAAVKDSNLLDETDAERDLRPRLNSFQLEPIKNLVKRPIERQATTSDMERLLQVLSKHDGSVRRTAEALDRPPEELFDDLYDLFTQEGIADLGVRFE